jgi:hypothetical protein
MLTINVSILIGSMLTINVSILIGLSRIKTTRPFFRFFKNILFYPLNADDKCQHLDWLDADDKCQHLDWLDADDKCQHIDRP